MKQDDIIGGADYGVDMFKGLDAWDLFFKLGLDQYRLEEVIGLVDSRTKDKGAHAEFTIMADPRETQAESAVGATQYPIKPECNAAPVESTISTTP